MSKLGTMDEYTPHTAMRAFLEAVDEAKDVKTLRRGLLGKGFRVGIRGRNITNARIVIRGAILADFLCFKTRPVHAVVWDQLGIAAKAFQSTDAFAPWKG